MRDRTIAGLLKRCDDLERALRPFAEAAPAFSVRTDETRLISTALADVTVGHLRTAQRVIEAGED